MSAAGAHGAPPALVDVLLRALAVAACVAALLGARDLFGAERGPWSPMAALALLIVGGLFVADVAQRLGFPRLIGYLTAGIALGPPGAGIVSAADTTVLLPVNDFALGLIALQAGAELTPAVLARTWRSAAWSTLFQTLLVPVACMATFLLLHHMFPLVSRLEGPALWAVAAVVGAVALSRSPGATMALYSELRPRGPLTEHVLAVVILLDVFVLLLFAAASGAAGSALLDEPLTLETFLQLGHELFASVAAGTSLGLLLIAFFRLGLRGRVLMIVVIAYGVSAFCRFFGYDTLFVFVVAGFVVSALSKQGTALLGETQRTADVVMVVFFATAGATLKVSALQQMWPVALAIVGVRFATTFVACRVGHRVAGDVDVVRRYAHLGFVSQAGMTIGLSALVAQRLGAIGVEMQALSLACVAIHELAGPTVFKWALKRADEIGKGDVAQDAHAHASHAPVTERSVGAATPTTATTTTTTASTKSA